MTGKDFNALVLKIEKHNQYINKKKEENAARDKDDYIRGMNRFNRLTKLHNAVIVLLTHLSESVWDVSDGDSAELAIQLNERCF